MPRQPLVEERVPPREKLVDTAVGADDRAEEQFRLLPQVEPHLVVEPGKLRGIGSDVLRGQPAEPEPLTGEVGDECVGPRVAQ